MVAGNTNAVATKAYCNRQYWLIQHSQLYWTLQNTWTYPTAQAYVERLYKEAPATQEQPLKGQLAVITNISANGSSYHVAEELALTAGMHLVLLSNHPKKLKTIEENLLKEAKRRGVEANQNYRKPTVFKVQYDAHSLKSVLEAAKDIQHIMDESEEYKGIPVLIHNPSGVTVAYQTTQDGVEINVGRNFVAPFVLTQQLLPLLKQAACPTFKPRIVYVSSVGHCQGTDFDPQRFLALPWEGGAPEGTLGNPGGHSGAYAAAATTASAADKVYAENEELDGPVTMYYRAKMALMADAQALAQTEPTLAPTSVYPGSVVAASSKKKSLGIAETLYQKGFYLFNLSPTQAARPTLRAALDPALNSGDLAAGSYLHCDGNPWQPADPTVDDPITGVPYEWAEYARRVRECTLQLTATLLENVYSPPDALAPETTSAPATEEKEPVQPPEPDSSVGAKEGEYENDAPTTTNEDAAEKEKAGEIPTEDANLLQMGTEQAIDK